MVYDLQKASIWKRTAAWMFDGILVSVLAVGVALIMSAVLQYDSHIDGINEAFSRYEELYGVSFEVTAEEYHSWTDEQKQAYDEAYEKAQEAMLADDQVIYNYNMAMNQTMIIVTVSILVAIAALEFAVPMFFKNGQTLGKKIFGLCIVRKDCVRVNSMQMFTRTILGKFTIETMVPVYVLLMLMGGMTGPFGAMLLLALGLAQILCMLITRNNAALHDLLAGTVVAEYSGQMIFDSEKELNQYKKKIQAEKAARGDD